MPSLCPSQLVSLVIHRGRPSASTPGERYCHVVAGTTAALAHVALAAFLLFGDLGTTVPVVDAEVPRIQLALLPRAPEQPPSERPAPTPSVESAVTPRPTPARPDPPQPIREQARIALPPPAPAQPLTVVLDAPPSDQVSVSAAPPAPTLPPGPVETSPSHDSWEGRVMARLERFRRYPGEARSHRQQGVAWVNATLDRNGELLAVRLQQSSGHPLLDEAAVATFQRAAPLPRVPADRSVPLQLQFPVEFALR